MVYEINLEGVRRMTSISPNLRAGATSQISIIDLADNSIQTITKGIGEKISPRWLSDGSIAYVNVDNKGGIAFADGRTTIQGEFNNPYSQSYFGLLSFSKRFLV